MLKSFPAKSVESVIAQDRMSDSELTFNRAHRYAARVSRDKTRQDRC